MKPITSHHKKAMLAVILTADWQNSVTEAGVKHRVGVYVLAPHGFDDDLDSLEGV